MIKDKKMIEWMSPGVSLAKKRNYTPQMIGWIAYSAVLIEQEKEIPPCSDDFEAQKALAALKILNDYLENECSYSDYTKWYDERGYSFETDMGYFGGGLENLEKCLIKRLRKAVVDNEND